MKGYTSLIMDSYVKYIESAGGRVVPLIYHHDLNTTLKKLENLNGVLYCGGGAGGDYLDFGRAIFKKAKEFNDKGKYFPVWGTCLGFEDLSMFAAESGEELLS